MNNDKTTAMRPFVVKDLLRMIMSRKNMAFDDALFYLYSSDLYMKLLDDEVKMWYMSTVALYDILEEEKRMKRRVELTEKILMFRVFCIESYCDLKDVYHEDALALFKQYDVFESLRRAGNRASRPGHRALARSSLLRDWFPCAGAVLSLAQTHRGRLKKSIAW